MLALVTCHISPLNLIRKKINSWHLASRLTARSLSELDRECILGKVFFFSLRGGGGGGVEFEFEFEFDAAAARSKSSSNCSGASSNASSNCVTASSNSSSSMWTASPDSESLVFFFRGGVRVRVRVRAGLTMQLFVFLQTGAGGWEMDSCCWCSIWAKQWSERTGVDRRSNGCIATLFYSLLLGFFVGITFPGMCSYVLVTPSRCKILIGCSNLWVFEVHTIHAIQWGEV